MDEQVSVALDVMGVKLDLVVVGSAELIVRDEGVGSVWDIEAVVCC